jgi:hypothetical protein
METRAFEETVHRRVSAMLRDRYGAPRFNLFYA